MDPVALLYSIRTPPTPSGSPFGLGCHRIPVAPDGQHVRNTLPVQAGPKAGVAVVDLIPGNPAEGDFRFHSPPLHLDCSACPRPANLSHLQGLLHFHSALSPAGVRCKMGSIEQSRPDLDTASRAHQNLPRIHTHFSPKLLQEGAEQEGQTWLTKQSFWKRKTTWPG